MTTILSLAVAIVAIVVPALLQVWNAGRQDRLTEYQVTFSEKRSVYLRLMGLLEDEINLDVLGVYNEKGHRSEMSGNHKGLGELSFEVRRAVIEFAPFLTEYNRTWLRRETGILAMTAGNALAAKAQLIEDSKRQTNPGMPGPYDNELTEERTKMVEHFSERLEHLRSQLLNLLYTDSELRSFNANQRDAPYFSAPLPPSNRSLYDDRDPRRKRRVTPLEN